MTGRDWLVVVLLGGAAVLFGWTELRQSNLGMLLTGRCEQATGLGTRSSLRCLDPDGPGAAP